MDHLIFQMLSLPLGKNEKQTEQILKILTKKQKLKIQRLVKNILNGRKTLTDSQYRFLSKHKNFLRNLGIGRFSVKNIISNYNAFIQILKILLNSNEHESSAKNNIGTFRGMGKNENKSRSRSGSRSKYGREISQQESETESEETDTYSEDSFESRKTISETYSSETELSGEEKYEKNEEGEQEENTSSG